VYNPGFVSRRALILVIAAGLTFLAGLGRGAIGDSDEAFYAEAAREMVESGDWLTPHYNYDTRFQKPVLYYWLASAVATPGGVTEVAARLPSALSGLALVLATWLCARRWYSEDVGLIAGLIVATNFGYFTMARMALPDLPLALLITVACWAVAESVSAGRAGEGSASRWWLLLASAASALGLLMKGPVGLVLPGLLGLVLLLRREPGPRWPWRPADLVLAAVVFVVLGAPWYLAMAREHGAGYLHHFFVGENLDRFATDRYNEPRPIWFYVPIVLGGLLPWSPFMAPWARTATRVLTGRRTLNRLEWTLLLWAAVPLVFYSMSIGKQPRYVLPMLPPLAILLAATVEARVASPGDRGRQRTLAWCTTTSAAILLVFGALLQHAKPLLFALSPVTGAIAMVTILVMAVGLLALGWAGRPRWIPYGIAIASATVLLSIHYSIYSAAGIEPVQKMAVSFKTHWPGASASGTYRVFVRNLVFYTGVKQTDLNDLPELAEFLSRDDRVLAVATEDDLQQLEARHGLRPVRLDRVTYFNAAGVRLRTLLEPDPAKDLETVWLVANR
jgi:4-amino-4-deoxy-L-arabinose transferase-like glycosyltransferase